MRRRQRGFFLNPFRFAGTTQSGALGVTGEAAPTLAGAAVASMALSSVAEGGVIWDTGQATSGAFSAVAESVATMAGASRAASSVSSAAEAVATFAPSGELITVDAADFDGSADHLARAALTGIANSKSGIMSYWMRLDVQVGVTCRILSGYDGSVQHFFVTHDNGNMSFRTSGAGGGISTAFSLANSTFAINTWYHVLVSWDAAVGTSATKVYVNDVAATLSSHTVNNTDALYASDNVWNVGRNPAIAAEWMNGGLAELYWAPGQYLDFSVEESRRKFRGSAGKPVNLGTTGSTPTGTAPLIYLHLDDGETANNFAINRGTGGNFTVTGALGNYPTSPSD